MTRRRAAPIEGRESRSSDRGYHELGHSTHLVHSVSHNQSNNISSESSLSHTATNGETVERVSRKPALKRYPREAPAQKRLKREMSLIEEDGCNTSVSISSEHGDNILHRQSRPAVDDPAQACPSGLSVDQGDIEHRVGEQGPPSRASPCEVQPRPGTSSEPNLGEGTAPFLSRSGGAVKEN